MREVVIGVKSNMDDEQLVKVNFHNNSLVLI